MAPRVRKRWSHTWARALHSVRRWPIGRPGRTYAQGRDAARNPVDEPIRHSIRYRHIVGPDDGHRLRFGPGDVTYGDRDVHTRGRLVLCRPELDHAWIPGMPTDRHRGVAGPGAVSHQPAARKLPPDHRRGRIGLGAEPRLSVRAGAFVEACGQALSPCRRMPAGTGSPARERPTARR